MNTHKAKLRKLEIQTITLHDRWPISIRLHMDRNNLNSYK